MRRLVGSDHVNLSRAVSFLLDGKPLEPEEHSHLLGCEECRQGMVDAASKKLRKFHILRGYRVLDSEVLADPLSEIPESTEDVSREETTHSSFDESQ